MKYFFTLVFASCVLAVSAQNTWAIDQAHSNIEFTATHMSIAEVSGSFADFQGQVITKGDNWDESTVTFTTQVASIDTDNEKRNGHLKSDDFFNAEKYPEITFNGMLKKKGDAYQLVGDFTIRDVTKQVIFDVKKLGVVDTGKGKKAGFKISGVINRFDFNLRWDNKIADGTWIVGEDIQIACNVELNEQDSM